MKKLTFQQKLWMPLVCSLVCITIIFLFEAVQTRNLRIDERSNDLRNIDDAGLSIVKQLGDKEKAGLLSRSDAQQQALNLIKGLRYGKDGYITITNGDLVSLMNPFKPENDGKNMSDFRDPKGTYLYRDITAAGRLPEGGGFVRYYWARPGSTEPVSKMSRVVHYAQWDWNLTTGVYMDDIDQAFYASLMKSAGLLALVCTALWLLVAGINRSLRRTIGADPEFVGQVAAQIAGGDLTRVIETHRNDHDSILFGMKSMQARLAETIGEIRRSADTIATASCQIASGNMDLSSRTESQASALQQTAASMEELTSTVTQNADNAVQANQLAISASAVAAKGGQVVSQVVRTMDTINDSSRKIVDIIAVIDGIAFQTNILALNAAVEAARAGEQGRGFAVVATEVRNLAHRSASAAREIKELIGASVDSIGAGSALVAEAGITMQQVVDSVSRVTTIMAAITSATSEQSTGIGHVNMAITEMDSVTQQNAALVEEAAAAAGSMQEQAGNLAQLVARFKLDGEARLPVPRLRQPQVPARVQAQAKAAAVRRAPRMALAR